MAKDLTDVLVSVRNMEVTFGSKRHPFVAVHDVSFDIYKGETFGLVGESGSGKTTIGRAIIRINPMSAGEVLFKGERISGKIPHELDKKVTQQIQMIFQDPMASLNERAKVDYIAMNAEKSKPSVNTLPKERLKKSRKGWIILSERLPCTCSA